MFLINWRCNYGFYGENDVDFHLSSSWSTYVDYWCCHCSDELLFWWIHTDILVSLGLQCFSRRNLSHVISNQSYLGEHITQ